MIREVLEADQAVAVDVGGSGMNALDNRIGEKRAYGFVRVAGDKRRTSRLPGAGGGENANSTPRVLQQILELGGDMWRSPLAEQVLDRLPGMTAIKEEQLLPRPAPAREQLSDLCCRNRGCLGSIRVGVGRRQEQLAATIGKPEPMAGEVQQHQVLAPHRLQLVLNEWPEAR
jgi:hypothetical protein